MILFLLEFSALVLAHISGNIPVDHSEYENWERLEAFDCSRPHEKLVRPVGRYTLADTFTLEEGKDTCSAPEWLLSERERLLRRVQPNEARFQFLWAQDETLKLNGLEASVVPSFPMRQGRRTFNGPNLYGEAMFGLEGGKTWGLALSITPGFVGGIEDFRSLNGRFYVQEGYAKVSYQRLEISYGRIGYAFGGPKHGSLFLTPHSAPLNGLSISVRSGGVEDSFENTAFQTFLTSQSSAFADEAKLWGVGLGTRLGFWGELGFYQIHQYGGKGFGFPSNTEYLSTLFHTSGPETQRKVHVGTLLHAGIWGPNHLAKVYGQIFWDDSSSILAGVWLPKLGLFDARVEYVSTGKGAYQSASWKQGFSYGGATLGHPLGSDGRGIYLDIHLPEMLALRPEIQFGYEGRGMALDPETRMSGGLAMSRRWRTFLLDIGMRFTKAENFQYVKGDEALLFGVFTQLQSQFH